MGGVIIAVSWCNRKTKCTYCSEEIKKATPMLIKKVWSSKKRRQYRFAYHFTCWIKEALSYLQEHPYEAAVDGRKKLDLTGEEREQRSRLLARRASIRQRIRTWREHPDTQKANKKVLDLMVKEMEIAYQINDVGGIPASWGLTWNMALGKIVLESGDEVLSDSPEMS